MPATQARINEIAHTISKALAPCEVHLYGSYARGTATEKSDLDILILTPEPPEHDVERTVVSSLERKYGPDRRRAGNPYVEVMHRTIREWEHARNIAGTIESAIADMTVMVAVDDRSGQLNARRFEVREAQQAQWLMRGSWKVEQAERALQGTEVDHEEICRMVQKSIEQQLKAVLAFQTGEFREGHNLQVLGGELHRAGVILPKELVERLRENQKWRERGEPAATAGSQDYAPVPEPDTDMEGYRKLNAQTERLVDTARRVTHFCLGTFRRNWPERYDAAKEAHARHRERNRAVGTRSENPGTGRRGVIGEAWGGTRTMFGAR